LGDLTDHQVTSRRAWKVPRAGRMSIVRAELSPTLLYIVSEHEQRVKGGNLRGLQECTRAIHVHVHVSATWDFFSSSKA